MKLKKKHDQFVRKCLTDIDMARGFLQYYLPEVVRDRCDFNKLNIVDGSYVEDDLKAYASDIVYSVGLKDDDSCAYVYALIEHQSSAYELMQYRIARYQLAIIQKHMDNNKKDKKLPLVVPIVFYNGAKSPYPYSTQLYDLFVDKELFKQVGLGNFKLADLTVIEDSEIAQHNKLSFLEMLVKHINNKNLKLIIKAFEFAHLYEISPSLVQSAIQYILSGKTRDEVLDIVKELKQNLPNYGEKLMNYADELHREGKQEGKQEGRQEGRQEGIKLGKHEAQLEIAKNLLKSGVDDKIVLQSTKITQSEIEQIKKSLH